MQIYLIKVAKEKFSYTVKSFQEYFGTTSTTIPISKKVFFGQALDSLYVQRVLRRLMRDNQTFAQEKRIPFVDIEFIHGVAGVFRVVHHAKCSHRYSSRVRRLRHVKSGKKFVAPFPRGNFNFRGNS